MDSAETNYQIVAIDTTVLVSSQESDSRFEGAKKYSLVKSVKNQKIEQVVEVLRSRSQSPTSPSLLPKIIKARESRRRKSRKKIDLLLAPFPARIKELAGRQLPNKEEGK